MSQPRSRAIFAHARDVHCLVFHALVVLAYALAFWLYAQPELVGIRGPWSQLAFVSLAALLLGWISGVDVGVNFHNHVHRRIFRQAWLNRWMARIWALFGGWPGYYWHYAHVVVHHRCLLTGADWTLPRRRADGRWENYYKYCLLHWPWRYARAFYQEFGAATTSPSVRARARQELAIFLLLWSLPFWFDWRAALCLWALPHYLANVMVLAPGMIAQHAGCEAPRTAGSLRHSNTFLGQLFNLSMFNIGYHAEHHSYPFVHWSELPELHARLRPELMAQQAHVVPFGYFRGGYLLSRAALGQRAAQQEFEQNHPEYR